mgnify:CR=1 FL=1
MNNKKIIALLSLSLIMLIFVFCLYSNKCKSKVYVETKSETKNKSNISMLLETKRDFGEYLVSNSDKWPNPYHIKYKANGWPTFVIFSLLIIRSIENPYIIGMWRKNEKKIHNNKYYYNNHGYIYLFT